MYPSMLNYPNSLLDRFELLHRMMDNLSAEAMPGTIRSVAAGTVPAINVGRTPTSIEVYAFAPGLDSAKIDVTLDRGVLRIAGERQSILPKQDSKGDSRAQVYASERVTGQFARAISLPDDVDPAKVNAAYRDGVLQISIGLLESAQPQRITVQ